MILNEASIFIKFQMNCIIIITLLATFGFCKNFLKEQTGVRV